MRVLCLVPVLLLGQILAAQTTESTGITLSGRVVSTFPVHQLALAPEGGSPGKTLYPQVVLDGTFEIDGLTLGQYRLSLVPPIKPGAEVPRIEVRSLTGAELVIYDPDRPDGAVVAKPGIAQSREISTGGSALLGTFFAHVRTQTFDRTAGGTVVDASPYRQVILEFRSTARQSQERTRDEEDGKEPAKVEPIGVPQ